MSDQPRDASLWGWERESTCLALVGYARGRSCESRFAEGGRLYLACSRKSAIVDICDRHKVLQSRKRLVKAMLPRVRASSNVSSTFLYYAHATYGINMTPHP